MRVAVVGAGIAGLAAAWELRHRAAVTVYDSGKPGGKLRASEICGVKVDEGADAFITRVPDGLELCRELGLEDQLVSPAAGRTLLWRKGELRSLPQGLVLGVPTNPLQVVRSGLVSPLGAARAVLDLVLPTTDLTSDVSVGRLIGARFGKEVADSLVDPLLGSIHAARIDELSAEAVAPHILAAARRSRSLLLGLRRSRPAATAPPPSAAPFASLRDGMASLADQLASRLNEGGTSFRGRTVRSVKTAVHLVVEDDEELSDPYDAVVLAVPATEAARMLGTESPLGLSAVEMTSVAVATVTIPDEQLLPPAGCNGMLVAPNESRLMTACSFFTNKWPHLKPSGLSILRMSAGRHDDDRISRLSDRDLVAAVVDELGVAVGRRLLPVESRVSRWPGALPLYRPGHLAKVTAIEAELESEHPLVALAGASYHGVGIPACIASGRRAARRVLNNSVAGPLP